MPTNTLPIAPNGIFWTLQGEGVLSGEPMAFVRLAGCSVGCAQCDTDYRVARRLTTDEIVAEVRSIIPKSFVWPWVWITGGEPTDHDLGPLVSALQSHGIRIALATAGVRDIPPLWNIGWISVSPHTSSVRVEHGHELKLVPGLNGLTFDDVERLRVGSFPYKFIQPIDYQTANGPEADGAASRQSMLECQRFVLSHPGWRLTLQAHKVWGLP